MVLWLGVAISLDSTIGFASNLEDPLRKPKRSSGPKFKAFEWLQRILLDALGDLLGLGLELGEMGKRVVILTTKWMRGSMPCFLGLIKLRYT